jgi:predicted nucleic acid-binding protein
VGPESTEIDSALDTFLRVIRPPVAAEGVRAAIAGLDDGEQEVIALAASMDGPVAILLDDHAARSAAKRLGLHVTGSVGILLLAKKRGLVAGVTPLLEEARSKGYWLSDRLVALAKDLAGE